MFKRTVMAATVIAIAGVCSACATTTTTAELAEERGFQLDSRRFVPTRGTGRAGIGQAQMGRTTCNYRNIETGEFKVREFNGDVPCPEVP